MQPFRLFLNAPSQAFETLPGRSLLTTPGNFPFTATATAYGRVHPSFIMVYLFKLDNDRGAPFTRVRATTVHNPNGSARVSPFVCSRKKFDRVPFPFPREKVGTTAEQITVKRDFQRLSFD